MLHNPTAGDRELPQRKLAELLRRFGYRPAFFSLKERAWKEKNALAHAEFVVVAGGDGSVRKAVLELHDCGRPLAILPLGTANNVCTSLGIEGSPAKIVASWSKAGRRKIDLGQARGPWGEKSFVESAGVGLIGRTIAIMDALEATADHRPEWREDRLHRDASVVHALAHELQPVQIRVQETGRVSRWEDYLLLEIMNISRAGPGLELAPRADPGDGWLNVVSVTVRERERLKRVLRDNLGAKKPRTVLAQHRIRSLRIECRAGEFRLDDQVVWQGPDRTRPAKKAVGIDITICPQVFEVLG